MTQNSAKKQNGGIIFPLQILRLRGDEISRTVYTKLIKQLQTWVTKQKQIFFFKCKLTLLKEELSSEYWTN